MVSNELKAASNAAPYLLGKLSFYSGVSRDSNPYPTDSQEHEEWDRGYDEAQSEERKDELKDE